MRAEKHRVGAVLTGISLLLSITSVGYSAGSTSAQATTSRQEVKKEKAAVQRKAAQAPTPSPKMIQVKPMAVVRLPLTIEAESLVSNAVKSGGELLVQNMSGFSGSWGGDAQLFWRAPTPVDEPIRNWPHLTLRIEVPEAAEYELVIRYTVAPDYGTARLFLAGQAVADINGYAATVSQGSRSLGTRSLAAGPHQIVVTMFSKDPSSTGYILGLDRFELYRVD